MVPEMRQVKVLVASEIAYAFKQACDAAHASMAMVLSQFMAEYAKRPMPTKVANTPDYSTRRRRRAALKKIVAVLRQIRDGEERSRENIPENFHGSEIWEKADEIIMMLDEAIVNLEDAMVP
jgi:hypothetical protein